MQRYAGALAALLLFFVPAASSLAQNNTRQIDEWGRNRPSGTMPLGTADRLLGLQNNVIRIFPGNKFATTDGEQTITNKQIVLPTSCAIDGAIYNNNGNLAICGAAQPSSGCLLVSGTVDDCLLVSGTTTDDALLVK